MVNLPDFFTSAVARSVKVTSSFATSDFLMPLFVAKASAMPPLVKLLADTAFFFMAFITFMATIVIRGGLKSMCMIRLAFYF